MPIVELRRREADWEWRAADVRGGPGELRGTVIKFGDVGELPWGRERFEPGSLELDDSIILNRQHDRMRPLSRCPGGGMDISVSPEAVRLRATIADTQDGRDTVALVRAGIMRGLSVEFVPEDEWLDDGVRVIRRARMVGVGVCDDGAYPQSEVAAMRARMCEHFKHDSGLRTVKLADWWW